MSGWGAARRLIVVALAALLLAACGGGTKQSTGGTPTAAGPPVSKSTYESKAVGVLRPMLTSIQAALRAPQQASSWQNLQRKATDAFKKIGEISPPSDISSLHRQLVGVLHNVAATAGGLFSAVNAGNLRRAPVLGRRLIHEGRQITNLGNQFKSKGYSQVGTILAGP